MCLKPLYHTLAGNRKLNRTSVELWFWLFETIFSKQVSNILVREIKD